MMLATVAVGTTSVAALAMHQAGLALAGSIAGRDLLVYLGFVLLVYPLADWRVVTIVPAIYLLAVAVVDRGPPLAFSRCPADSLRCQWPRPERPPFGAPTGLPRPGLAATLIRTCHFGTAS
ncbi:MAG: hypothetical protein WEB29_03095 [Chloroflexota bacterium]